MGIKKRRFGFGIRVDEPDDRPYDLIFHFNSAEGDFLRIPSEIIEGVVQFKSGWLVITMEDHKKLSEKFIYSNKIYYMEKAFR